jgi:predicted nucleotidyltransferase
MLQPDRIATRITSSLRLPPESHKLLQENLACYVTHLKPEFQDRLERTSDDELLTTLRQGYAHGEQRWTEKLLRDVARPYSDEQVQARFELLEARFSEEGQRIQREHLGSFPCQVFVTGSVVKGRFGANSDLDAVAVTKASNYRPSAYGDVAWQVTDAEGKDFYLRSFLEAVEVNPNTDRPVLQAYREGLEAKGLQLDMDQHGNWQIQRVFYPRRDPEPKPQTSMMWSFADLP